MKLILIWILNAMAVIAVANFVPGIRVDGFLAALAAAFFIPAFFIIMAAAYSVASLVFVFSLNAETALKR